MTSPSCEAESRAPAWRALFRLPDFRRLWIVGLSIFVVRWLETLAIGVFVYEASGSAFIVAMVTMLRVLPMGLFGAFIGAFAERLDRRHGLIAIMLGSLATSLILGVLALAGQLAVWQLALASFINGISWAADNPVRRALIGEVAGAARMGTAMSVDVGSNNASRMLGPTLGGVLLATAGIEGVFLIGAALYVAGTVAAFRIEARSAAPPAAPAPVLARIAEGIAVVRGDPRLIGTLVITLIFNLFGWPFTSMIPVIGRDQLHLGPEGIGVLGSLDGIGAFAGAVLVALLAGPRHYALCYIGGVTLYLA
ncbi:MAG TPA: MFS transporter, partial [Acetobacteraceae bacterium]|nr:MFS transporter [Acetobacteraceae bacterium]